MAASPTSVPPQRSVAGRIGWGIMWVFSAGLLVFLIVSLVIRFVTPIPLYRLRVEEDIPLPSALAYATPTSSPLAPGLAVRQDHFDFQALDPQTHLLFINHSGPPIDRALAAGDQIDEKYDGNIVVVNTALKPPEVVGLVEVPQTTGMAVATGMGWVYASDANDSIIYGINEHTLQTVQIPLKSSSDSPDAMAYDPIDHRMFVSDPGSPISRADLNINPANQNVAVINVLNNTLVTEIPFGVHRPYGDDVGHVQYDITSHRVFVITRPLPNQNLMPIPVTPPSYIDVIDPTLPIPEVISQIKLPDTCVGPHGFVVDSDQEIGFVVCRETYNVARVNLRTLQPFPDAVLLRLPPATCDIARIDHPLHLLFIGCVVGIAIFDESPGKWTSLGYQYVGGSSNHTIVINEDTQEIYVPLASLGDRPVLRIVQYIPNGVEPGAGT
jgi:DNA-binding beta-propeller fold protein YncE